MGFLLYGSNMLVGIFVAEVANPVVKATAQGLTGAWAGVGGALANYPLGLVISLLGWSHFFLVLMLCCFFTMLVVLPMWHVCEPKKQKTA
jgi:sugar phosphate permease